MFLYEHLQGAFVSGYVISQIILFNCLVLLIKILILVLKNKQFKSYIKSNKNFTNVIKIFINS
jgi:hypothetical protein